MDTELELISETQNKLKELLDCYNDKSLSIKKSNEERIEELYGQILGFIAEKFEAYKIFYTKYCNKVHDIATVYVKHSYDDRGDWIDVRANSDWTQFFFAEDYCGIKVSHKRIVLNWQRIKEDFLMGLENHKEDYLRTCEKTMYDNIKLKEQLDEFEL